MIKTNTGTMQGLMYRGHVKTGGSSREIPAQFEDRIKPPVYLRRITRRTMYEKAPFVSGNWYREI